MGRRGRSLSGGGIQFVSQSIGSLVTLKSSENKVDLDTLEVKESGRGDEKVASKQHLKLWEDVKDKKRSLEIQRLDSLWDRNEKLVAENQKLMVELQSLPASEADTSPDDTLSTLKEMLPAPLPVVLDAWDQRPSFLKFGDNVGTGDATVCESIANVATSAPFLYIGLNTPRTKPYDRLYARSMMVVGVASSMYHASRGTTRPFFRWCDYAAIGASSMCLTKALNPDISNRWLLLSASALPFQPMLVTAVNTALMEVKFARRSLKDPQRYQKAHRMHAASTLLGGVFFLAEEVYPDLPFVHAAWHVAAALGVYTCNALLK